MAEVNETGTAPPAVIEEQKTSVAVADAIKLKIRSAEDALEIAQSMTIGDNDDYQFVIDERNANLRTIDYLKAEMKSALDPLTVVMTKVRGWFAPGIANTEAAVRHQNRLITTYDALLTRQREEAAAKQRETERLARQEAEQKAAAALALAEEQAAEQRRIAAKAQDERIAALKIGDEKAAQAAAATVATALETANHVVETGKAAAEAAAVQSTAAMQTRTMVDVVPAVTGNSNRKHFVAELAQNMTEETAKLKIILAIAEQHAKNEPMPLLGLLEIDHKAMKKLAQSLELNMHVPGYVAVNRPIAVGSKK